MTSDGTDGVLLSCLASPQCEQGAVSTRLAHGLHDLSYNADTLCLFCFHFLHDITWGFPFYAGPEHQDIVWFAKLKVV